MDLINRIFKEDTASKDMAVERLRLVLIHDRASVSTGLMESIKEELFEVISKYMEIDESNTEVRLNSGERSTTLIANIPVRKIKR